MPIHSLISQSLHNLLFLEEFAFSRNQFSPPGGSEVEFADAVVLVGDALMICQLKERAVAESGDPETERKWFDAKVRGKATRQVRDTLTYLSTYQEILVPNGRGHQFNLAAAMHESILKLVIYSASPLLPDDCRQVKFHVSRSAGFIHIVDARDYLNISRVLRVPEEMIRYFQYREEVLEDSDSRLLPEAAIVGHFVGGDANGAPTRESVKNLYRLIQDDRDWDLAPILRRLHDNTPVAGDRADYYGILREFHRLPRSMWRAIKERFDRCVEIVSKDEFAQPFRIVSTGTGCGFIFIPVDSEIAGHPDWETMRLTGITNLTLAHKYDQKLDRCVGVQIARSRDCFDVLWCLIEFPWQEDSLLQHALDRNNPLRPVKHGMAHGYRFGEEGT